MNLSAIFGPIFYRRPALAVGLLTGGVPFVLFSLVYWHLVAADLLAYYSLDGRVLLNAGNGTCLMLGIAAALMRKYYDAETGSPRELRQLFYTYAWATGSPTLMIYYVSSEGGVQLGRLFSLMIVISVIVSLAAPAYHWTHVVLGDSEKYGCDLRQGNHRHCRLAEHT